MAQEITKPHPQDCSLETCRLLYSTAWDQAFREVMFLMAEQYSRELLVEIDGRQAPSPVMRFWRESLQRLSPAQMREGLRLYMKSERGSYKPNPEDIVHNAVDVEVKDRPVKRKDPNCPECGGSGFRQVEVKSRTRPGNTIQAVTDCYCVRIDYAGKTFTSTGKMLGPRSGDRVIARDRVIEGKNADHAAANVVKRAVAAAKTMPRTKPLDDAEYNQRRQMLERQKEKILEESGDPVIR